MANDWLADDWDSDDFDALEPALIDESGREWFIE